jgi:hypothetical protein
MHRLSCAAFAVLPVPLAKVSPQPSQDEHRKPDRGPAHRHHRHHRDLRWPRLVLPEVEARDARQGAPQEIMLGARTPPASASSPLCGARIPLGRPSLGSAVPKGACHGATWSVDASRATVCYFHAGHSPRSGSSYNHLSSPSLPAVAPAAAGRVAETRAMYAAPPRRAPTRP